jgi:hypothetical protein
VLLLSVVCIYAGGSSSSCAVVTMTIASAVSLAEVNWIRLEC